MKAIVIDNEKKEEMRVLDGTRRNYFSNDFSLIMSVEAYKKHFPIGVPFFSLEHRIMYVRRGESRHTLNMMEHVIRSGDLVLLPANYCFDIQYISPDFDACGLTFRIHAIEKPELIGYDIRHLHLEVERQHIVEGYFSLMEQIVQQPKPSGRDLDYLITSFLFHIQHLHSMEAGDGGVMQMSRGKRLQAEFMRILVGLEVPVRSVSYYAERLCVSDGYLQTIIKEEMHRPVMYWVNQVTVNKLKVMLKEEGLSLEAVAKVMGFGGASQMIRFFKRETGMTPAEFRKK